MKNSTCFALVLGFCALPLAAQPVVTPGGVVNAASYSLPGLPNSSIARGSFFVVFGEKLGITSDPNALKFPLPTAAGLGGTSIKVTVGSSTVDAIMVYTTPTQVGAVLPSSTPAGSGRLTLTYNGQSSAAIDVTVVASSVGLFTRNSAGNGPPIAQVALSATDTPLVDVRRPVQPGQTVILWATGLGAVTGNETAGPLPGDLQSSVNVEVYVGLKKVAATYAGRSGCCVGIDQIVFQVPEGVEGCYVPVAVRANNVVSNFPTMAISKGTVCSDPNGLSTTDFTSISATNAVKVGVIDLSRFQLKVDLGFFSVDVKSDTGTGLFGSYSGDQIANFRGISQTGSLGTCGVNVFRGLSPTPVDSTLPTPLDAGASISVTGPRGTKPLNRVSTGTYAGTLGGTPIDQILTGVAQPDYLDAGDYTLNNAIGAAIGGFNIRATLPAPIVWTNSDSLTAIDRTKDLLITWVPGSPQSFVLITGIGTASGANGPTATTPGAAFQCLERADAGKFTVPAWILGALPTATGGGLVPSSFLLVGGMGPPTKFSAPNLDLGYFTYRSLSGKNVVIR